MDEAELLGRVLDVFAGCADVAAVEIEQRVRESPREITTRIAVRFQPEQKTRPDA